MKKRVWGKALVPLLCAVLLGAQHFALAHILSHLGDDKRPASEKTLVHHKLCDKCVSAEKLAHCAPNSGVAALALSGGDLQPISQTYACFPQESRRYNSRGPPHLL